MIVVVSGPSGVGKTTLCDKLLAVEPRLQPCVTATTRPPRPNEVGGKDYYFISRETFVNWLKKGEIIEYTELFSHLYGTPRKSIEQIVKNGKYPLLRIDVQGVRQLRKLGYKGVFIFILSPDLATLEQRLKNRFYSLSQSDVPKSFGGSKKRFKKQVDEEDLRKRLGKAREELACKGEYDFQVVNDSLDKAVSQVKEILNKYLFKLEQ